MLCVHLPRTLLYIYMIRRTIVYYIWMMLTGIVGIDAVGRNHKKRIDKNINNKA